MKLRAKQGNPRRAVGYIRVSTTEQKLGPKAQADALELWVIRQGVELVACFVDSGVSGATPFGERKALLGAVQALQTANAGILVASKRDRLARGVAVVAVIEAEVSKAGACIRTADGASDGTGAGGLLTRGMADLLGAWERETIRERTRAALEIKRIRGERIGGVPYGSAVGADGARLEPLENEQRVIALVRELSAKGMSTRAIVGELADRGIRSRSGKALRQTQVWRIVQAAGIAA